MSGDTVVALDAPKALPSVPCLTWGGARVRWEPWQPAPILPCTGRGRRSSGRSLNECDACAFPGPLRIAFGFVEGLSRASRAVPDRGLMHLSAHLCPQCLTVNVHELSADETAPSILCDGCDVLCAVGSTLEEARATLVTLGGWTGGGDADWDLCPACNPTRNPEAPPRAHDAFRRAGAT